MLEGKFPVYDSDKPVGEGTLTPAGLYMKVDCDCGVPGGTVVRLVLRTDAGDAVLGIPVPEEGRLRLRRKLPGKYLPQGENARLCLYTQWPLPDAQMEENGEIEEDKSTVVEEKENKMEAEKAKVEGTPYIDGGPVEGLEDWQSLRTVQGPDGGLMLKKT